MKHAYLVRQDGANFYLYDGSALEAVVSYTGRVRDFNLEEAMAARVWFENLSRKWGFIIEFEGALT